MGPIDGSSLKSICLIQSGFPIPLAVLKNFIFPCFKYISLYSLKGVSKTFKKCSDDLIEERSTKKVLMDSREKDFFATKKYLSDYPNKIIWFTEVSSSIVNYLEKKMQEGENLAVKNALTFATTLMQPTKSSDEPELPFFCCYGNFLIKAVHLRNVGLVEIICGLKLAKDTDALFEACKLGDVKILEALLENDVALAKRSNGSEEYWDINPQVLEKALKIAKENGHENVIKFLNERFSWDWDRAN